MTCLKYWPNHLPIPKGWELANDLSGCHHGLYSVLIREKFKMRTLKLAVKRKYFEQIKSGEKTEEYRLCTPYWEKRLSKPYNQLIITLGYPKREDPERNLFFPYVGWQRKTITHEHFNNKPCEVFAIILTHSPSF